MKYLVFWLTHKVINPINKKVEAIVNTNHRNNKRQVSVFIGLVKYYRYTWYRRSHLLQPLTTITPDKVTLKWAGFEHRAFEDIKHIIARYTLLEYPDLNKRFDIHTGARYYQIVELIIHEVKPTTFYTCKLIEL